MWTDLAAQIWPALPLFFLAGACFVIGGTIWWTAIRRHNLTLGPLPRKLAAPPAVAFPTLPRHARPDSATGVVAYIPGATRVAGFVADVDQAAEVLRVIDTEEPGGLLAGLPEVPVCPTCGGPYGNCACYSKADLCPLTTQEIEVPAEAPPMWRETSARTRPDAHTHNLSAALEKVRQA